MSEKSFYDISLPVAAYSSETSWICRHVGDEWVLKAEHKDITLVTNLDVKKYRNAVYRFARYFKREFQYDFIQYQAEGEEDVDECQAFLFSSGDVYFGACCFRYREYLDAPPGWALQWIWLHPFFRGQGFWLNKCYPLFKERFGERFDIEAPLSKSMEHFVQKYHAQQTGQNYETNHSGSGSRKDQTI